MGGWALFPKLRLYNLHSIIGPSKCQCVKMFMSKRLICWRKQPITFVSTHFVTRNVTLSDHENSVIHHCVVLESLLERVKELTEL